MASDQDQCTTSSLSGSVVVYLFLLNSSMQYQKVQEKPPNSNSQETLILGVRASRPLPSGWGHSLIARWGLPVIKLHAESVDHYHMDRRFHTRLPANLEVRLTELRDPKRSISGCLCDISQSGICVTLPLQLAPNDLVQLNVADSVLFGHVRYSCPEGSVYRIGVEVERVLLGGSDLSQLLQMTLNRLMPGRPGLDPTVSGHYRLR